MSNEKMLKMMTMHKKRLFVITDSWRSLRYLVLVSSMKFVTPFSPFDENKKKNVCYEPSNARSVYFWLVYEQTKCY